MSTKTASDPSRLAKSLIAILGFVAVTLPVAFGLVYPPTLCAQLLHPTAPLPSFEVAAIKPFDQKSRIMPIGPLGSQQIVHAVGTELSPAAQAFNALSRSQIVAGLGLGLGWNDSKRYVIEAKIPDDFFSRMQAMTAAERRRQTQLMLQSLLADRFKMKTHFATWDMPIYELVVDKGGSKLPPPNEPPAAAGGGWAMSPQGEMRIRNMKLDELLQSSIFELGDRPIVNQTGLTGTYNLTLHWKPPTASTAPKTDDGFFPATDDSGPSIFAVVQEQLGLKLVASRGPVEVVIIDQFEQPSAN
jgi:uncharacterized protein (TIGR03435 family)